MIIGLIFCLSPYSGIYTYEVKLCNSKGTSSC